MKNFSKVFFWGTIIPLIALALAILVKDDPGLVIISGSYPFFDFNGFSIPKIIYKPMTIQTTLIGSIVYGILLFILLYLIIRLLSGIFIAPRRLRNRYKIHQEHKAEEDYSKAQLFLLENKPRQAEGLFVRAADYSAHPSLCLLGAAKAAHLQKSQKRRDAYLREIDLATDKKNHELAQIQRGEFLLSIGEDEMAEKAIEHFAHESNNRNAVLLLAKTYRQRGAFKKLYNLMPDLQRAVQKLPDIKEQKMLYIDLLEFAAQEGNTQDVKNVWNNIPKELRNDEDLIIKYADRLMICNDTESAETILRQAIRKEPKRNLMLAYGHLYRGNINQLIRQATRFANERSDNAYAQFALGKLELRAKNFNAAITSAEKALKLDPTLAVAHKLYGEAKLAQGDKDAALLAFQRANEILMPETPDDIEKKEGEVLIDNTAKLTYVNSTDDELTESLDSVNKPPKR